MSFMKKHQQKTWAQQAKQAKKAKNEVSAADTSSKSKTAVEIQLSEDSNDEMWWSSCKQDVARLKELPGREERDELKRDHLIEKYQPYMDKWLAAETQGKNDIVAYCIMWQLDGGDVKTACEWAELAESRGVSFNMIQASKTPTVFFSDQVHRYVKEQFEKTPDEALPDYFKFVMGRINTGVWELGNTRSSFFYRLKGLKQLHDGKKEKALANFITADTLNGGRGGVGVGTRIKELQAEIEEQKADDASVQGSDKDTSTSDNTDT